MLKPSTRFSEMQCHQYAQLNPQLFNNPQQMNNNFQSHNNTKQYKTTKKQFYVPSPPPINPPNRPTNFSDSFKNTDTPPTTPIKEIPIRFKKLLKAAAEKSAAQRLRVEGAPLITCFVGNQWEKAYTEKFISSYQPYMVEGQTTPEKSVQNGGKQLMYQPMVLPSQQVYYPPVYTDNYYNVCYPTNQPIIYY